MKQLFTFLLFLLLLSGCIGAKRFNKIAHQKYAQTIIQPDSLFTDYLSFKTDKLVPVESLVKSTSLKTELIPLILYWQWEKIIKCELDPKTQADQIASNLIVFGESSQLGQKLAGQRLEISIETIPNTFIYTRKGHLLFLFYLYHAGEVESIIPLRQSLHISYTLYKGDVEIKRGTIEIPGKNQPLISYKSSTKKFIRIYIDTHETIMKDLSKELFKKLLLEL